MMILPKIPPALTWVLLLLGIFFNPAPKAKGTLASPGVPGSCQSVSALYPAEKNHARGETHCPENPTATTADSPSVDFTPLVRVSTVAGTFSLLVALVWSTGLVLAARQKYRKGGQ